MRLPSSRTVPRLGSLIMLGLLMGCIESISEPAPPPTAPTDVVFASFLGIDLDAMTLSPSGLYYSTLEEGGGVGIAAVGDTVDVHFTGWLPSGTQFDSTEPLSPLRVTLGSGLIAGFDEGLQGMRLNETRVLVIPYQLGYGSEGLGGIPSFATLVFLVTIVSLEKAAS